MKATHTTKKGFGGLLKEGLRCRITRQNGEEVLIEVDGIAMYNGNIKDLKPLK